MEESFAEMQTRWESGSQENGSQFSSIQTVLNSAISSNTKMELQNSDLHVQLIARTQKITEDMKKANIDTQNIDLTRDTNPLAEQLLQVTF